MRVVAIRAVVGLAVAATLAGDIGGAQAHDFFSQFFGGPSRRSERSIINSPFAPEFESDGYGRRRPEGDGVSRRRADGGEQSYCVRTCDGRYFPISAQGEQSKAAACNSFCPASETRVYSGSNIDNASSDRGKRYSDMPNAFKYRTELVAGCTCDGKNTTGLAPVKIENDPTLKRGDIVAGADALLVNRGTDRRGASLNFSPVADAVRAKYGRPAVVEAD